MHLEIGNAFAKFLEMHFQKLKMHLQNPWKCICKSMEIHGNAFKKPKLEMHFFSPGTPGPSQYMTIKKKIPAK